MKYEPNEHLCDIEQRLSFVAWQPSTWPEPNLDIHKFANVLRYIFEDSLLSEIDNVIEDAQYARGDLDHRTHVIALALFCAVDVISSYAFNVQNGEICECCGKGEKVRDRYVKYIEEFFPEDYHPFAKELYSSYRNSLTHSWNLFKVALTTGNEPIERYGQHNSIVMGVLNFKEALEISVNNFLQQLTIRQDLQQQAYERFNSLRSQAIS